MMGNRMHQILSPIKKPDARKKAGAPQEEAKRS